MYVASSCVQQILLLKSKIASYKQNLVAIATIANGLSKEFYFRIFKEHDLYENKTLLNTLCCCQMKEYKIKPLKIYLLGFLQKFQLRI